MIQSKYTRRNEQQWEILVREFEISGLSKAAFCREHSISYTSFCAWHKRLGSGLRVAVSDQGAEPLFTPLISPLSTDSPDHAHSAISIKLALHLSHYFKLQLVVGV